MKEHKRLDVHSISELLNVSEVTIRRDLEKLEADGFLTRMHGGAVPAQAERELFRSPPPAAGAALGPELQEADEVARMAILMVKDGDVVFLLNGAINQRLARLLADRSGVTVLTNDMLIALEISGQSANRAVLLGGAVDHEERALFGSLTLSNLKNFCVNHLFLEPDGISEQLVLTVNRQEKADLIREALQSSDEAVALCASAGFGKNAFYRLGPVATVARIVASQHMPDDYKTRLFGSGVELFTSVLAFEKGS